MTRLAIGLSACFFHADPMRPIFKGRTLLYEEQSMTHWVMSKGALPLLLPVPAGEITTSDLLDTVHGIVFQGGSDVSPQSYGETPLKPEWEGDSVRDAYEIELVHQALERNIPVLGVCRGLQLMNVALGGTLYQDITEQRADALVHRNWNVYEKHEHGITLETGSTLRAMYGRETADVNSVHHQAIKDLAPRLQVEARSADGIIEAVRLPVASPTDPFLFAVQWHPEFQTAADTHLLPASPILDAFLRAARERAR